MPRTARPDLQSMSKQLARNNARVVDFLDGLPSRIDRLVEAAEEEHWAEVRRLTEYLDRAGEAHGQAEISRRAQIVCRQLDDPRDEIKLKQSIVRLIGSCGTARP